MAASFMEIVGGVVGFGFLLYYWKKEKLKKANPQDLKHLPERFVVFDLETTGLDSSKHEIIEIGAIRVNRDSTEHETFQSLVKPKRKVPKKITEITGITHEMVMADGEALDEAVRGFMEFAGDLPLVSFNAEFDMAFLRKAARDSSLEVNNEVSCALLMARRAWPGRKSYRLANLAADGNLDGSDAHRALADCKRALIVYAAASARLGSSR